MLLLINGGGRDRETQVVTHLVKNIHIFKEPEDWIVVCSRYGLSKLNHYTASQTRRPQCTYAQPSNPQISEVED